MQPGWISQPAWQAMRAVSTGAQSTYAGQQPISRLRSCKQAFAHVLRQHAQAYRLNCALSIISKPGQRRLCWNAAGSLLASASDDHSVLLWSFPAVDRKPLHVATQHMHNIFGVAFLPGDERIVTGASSSRRHTQAVLTASAVFVAGLCMLRAKRHHLRL